MELTFPPNLDPKAAEAIRKYKIQRAALGDKVSMVDFCVDQVGDTDLLRSKVGVDLMTDSIIRIISQEPFGYAISSIKAYIYSSCPTIFNLIPQETYSAKSFKDFARSVYSRDVLCNELDLCLNPYWFLRALKIAEIW